MTSPSSRVLGCVGVEVGKGQLVRLSEGQPSLQRGMQASLLDSCCYNVHLSMLAMDIALCCTSAPLLSPKAKQSNLRVAR